MLRNSETDRDLKAFRVLYSILLASCIFVQLNANPVTTTDYELTKLFDNSSSTPADDDLYVIKAVVYEIGILTDANNTTDDTTERQEEVKISFFNSPKENNETTMDTDIPASDTLLQK